SVGELRSDRSQRNLVADLVVLRAAHDLEEGAAARIHLGHRELLRIRVGRRFFDLSDEHAAQSIARALDPLHLESRQRQPLRQLGRRRKRHVLGQPLNRDPHQNCSRKRTSFSNIRRRSSIRYLSSAIRSTPIPKAKPVYCFGSYSTASKTLGCTMPAPIAS